MAISNKPTWTDVAIKSGYPRLTANAHADVVIAGGGLAGLLCAYTLAKAGKRVIVLEAATVGDGITAATTAFLTQSIDTDVSDLLSMHGKANARLIISSHQKAIDYIEQIIEDEHIDCDFMRVPDIHYSNEVSEEKALQDEYTAYKKLGIEVALRQDTDLGFVQAGHIVIPNQAKFHPLKFINGLLPALQELGVTLYEHTEVKKVRKGKGVAMYAGSHKVTAQHGIIATYKPLGNPIKTFGKKGMYVTYVYELRIPKGIIAEGIYEDSENPYHYFRVDRNGAHDRMIIGGEDNRQELRLHKQKNFNVLKKYVDQLLFGKKYTITRKWSGPILEPSDGLALIGKLDEHRLVATAFSGNGMTYSAIAAMLCRDIILGKSNRWKKLYDPTRIPTAKQLLKKGKDYAQEFFGGVVKNALE